MATAMNNSPIAKLKRMPMAVMRRMGWVSRRPQYWLDSTTTPSPTPLTTICSRNCTWLAWVTPVMDASLKLPSMTLSARLTAYTIRF